MRENPIFIFIEQLHIEKNEVKFHCDKTGKISGNWRNSPLFHRQISFFSAK
jgi:hypothetical protein